MIVTCPGCASKYRVRNEAVPAEGARMRCPKCETLFLAKPPPGGAAADETGSGIDAPTGQFAAMAPPAAPSMPPGFAPPAAGPGFSAPPGTGASSPFGGFGAPPGASLPPTAAPSPFDGLPPAGSAPFGAAPSPSPFGAAPSPFGAAPPSPFGAAPSPSPFGAAPSPSPFGASPSPFGGAAPQNPQTAGPLTAMMARFDPSSMPPGPSSSAAPSSSAPRPPDDDPFANLDLGAPARPAAEVASPGFSAPPPTSSSTLPSSPARPATQGPSATRPPTQASPPPALARPRSHGSSLAAQAASWLFVVASAATAAGGAVFAAWTSGAVDLDERLMPIAEAQLGVRPPYSFVGLDAPPLDELRRQAKDREDAGDLPAAAVLWRRILDAEPTDATAKTALPRVLTALGERLR